ncbi:MAG: hypothetical protein RH916_10725 [Vicingaceae bacterium]
MRSGILISSILAILSLGIHSCSKEKNTFSSRAYHNTTSHYNYFFNARELIRAYESSIKTSHIDDYNYLLPIFVYGSDEQAKGAYDSMDEVIKKCSKLIDRHSIYLKNEEYNRWIDESYLLVGRAKFHKQEYFGAIEIYEYITYAFPDKPSYFAAKIWMARCYLEMGDNNGAFDILESIKESSVALEYKSEYYALYADLDIRESDWPEATLHLRSAIEFAPNIELKRRYTYILAQVYHDRKDYPNATKYYGEVLKLRPDYRMSFNAKLNQARSYDVSANNSTDIKKRLKRMLRDKKNLEFQDQIYFAMAELAFREEDEALGMEYLRKSAATSVSNNKVKAEAYMLLGDIFFDKPKYIPAHAYYDSCLTILPPNHQKFDRTDERKKSLDDLVENLLIIRVEDSLRAMASLSEKERDKIIAGLVKKAEQNKEEQRLQLERGFAQSYELANKRSTGTNAGQWYFYNQSNKSFGVSEFKKQWGDRTLEDNWRRKDKNTLVTFSSEEDAEAELDSLESVIDETDVEFYLRQLPLTDSAMAASHNKVIDALYAAGNIFREDFMDYKSANLSFLRIVNEYDTCRHTAPSYYQLYRIALLTEDGDLANKYRLKILEDYPFSEYARIINNPDYIKNKRDKKEQIEAYYRATYQLYQYGLYGDVIATCGKSDSLFGNSHMKPKFDYLKALAYGKSKKPSEFKKALEEVVATYPSDDVGKAAQKILDKMGSMEKEKEFREALYKKNFRDEHVFVVMVPNNSKTVDDVKLAISDYNLNSVGPGKYNVGAVVFNGSFQMISVKSFKDKNDGMVYLQNISQYPDFLNKVVKKQYDRFIISTENFAYFYKEKNVATYLSFYADNYLN